MNITKRSPFVDRQKSFTLLLILLFSYSLSASHFRYGDISWRVLESDPSGRTIEFKVNTGWRLNSPNNLRFYFGDGNSATLSNVLTNVNGEYTYATGTVIHTYASNGNYTAFYGGCCKISNLANNRDNSWFVQSQVNVGSGNNSPVTTMPAIVNLQTNQAAASFTIPATDPDGDILSFALANNSQHAWPNGSTQPAGISVNPQTGQVNFNTQGKAIGSLWNTAVAISDGNTTVLVDFIIKITQVSSPPRFDYSITPANNYVFNCSPGQNISFDIKAFDTDPGSSVSVNGIGVPSGATVGPTFGNTGNPINHSFSWTPAVSQFGTYVMNFIAQDNNGVQSQTSISIIVSLKPQFDSPPTPPVGSHLVYTPGDTISYNVQASDPDTSDVVSIINAQGKNMAGNKIPLYNGAALSPLPTPSGNPSSGSFSWTTHGSDWGHKHVFFTAVDSYGDKTVHEVSQLINTPPLFSSSPVTSALVNQPYSYTIKVSDPDTAYGDQISIHGLNMPGWLNLTDNGDGTATLFGTPGPLQLGLKNISIQAEDLLHHDDPRGIIIQNFTLNVRNCFINLSVKNAVLNLDPNGQATLPPGDVLAYGSAICGPLTYSVAPNNFSCADIGSHTVVLSATDAYGNVASAPTTVTVVDNTPPQVSAQNLSLSLDASGLVSITAADVFSGASDACGVDSIWISQSSFSCADAGSNKVVLTVSDLFGNTATDTAQIHILDQTPPTASTKNISLPLDASGQATLTAGQIDNASSDMCGIDSMWVTPANFHCQDAGINQVTLHLMDSHGNTASGNAQVTVVDPLAPNVLTQNVVLALDSSGQATLHSSQIDYGSNDACGIDSLSINNSNFNCSQLGMNQVTLRAWDVHGNLAASAAQVEVIDNIAPHIQCPADISVVAQANDCKPQVFWTPPVAWDNCSYVITSSHQPGDRFDEGSTTVNYQITDAAGNQSSDSFEVLVSSQPLTLNLNAASYNGGWNVSCQGASDASISTTIAGGCQPYSFAWSNGSSRQDLNGIAAGKYQLLVTDAKGRTRADSINISEPPPLLLSISGSPVFTTTSGVDSFTVYLAYGTQTIKLVANALGGTPGYSYNWLPTAGLSSYNTASTQATPGVASMYVCKVTDLNNCERLDSFFVDVVDNRCGNNGNKVMLCHNGKTLCINPTAVASHLQHGDKLGPCSSSSKKADLAISSDKLSYQLFPNPTTGEIQIDFDDAHSPWLQMSINDMSGKTLLWLNKSEHNHNKAFTLDLSAYESGIYLLRITTATASYTEKIILQ